MLNGLVVFKPVVVLIELLLVGEAYGYIAFLV
jgi:hypothetical protein